MMRPEFPHHLDLDKLLTIVDAQRPIPCEMLRLETLCSNDARTIHIYERADGKTETLAICDMCKDEMYTQQREWRY